MNENFNERGVLERFRMEDVWWQCNKNGCCVTLNSDATYNYPIIQ